MPPPNPFSPDQQPSVFDTTAPPAPMLQPSTAVNVPSVFAPPPQAPSVFSPLQSEEDTAQGKLQKLNYQDSHPWGSPDNHPGVFGKIAHGLSLAGNIAGNIFAPAVMANIPGTDAHRQVEEQGLNREVQGLEKEKVQNQAQQAEADRAQQQTQFAAEQEPGELQAQQDTHAHSVADTKKLETPAEPNWQHIETDQGIFAHNPKTNEMIPLTYQGKPLAPKAKEINASQDLQNQIADAARTGDQKKVKQLQQQLEALNPMGQQRLNISLQGLTDREQNHAQSEKDKLAKPTADEQKKADLVDNLNENLGVVEEIARRRPELFGPIAGRLTQMKNSFGTSDGDIAALEAAQHQLGMVQQGVHGMRSAQGLQGSVDSLMNGFHNTPEAMLKSIETARKSAQTFSNDVGHKGEPGVGGVPGGGVMYARDPQGKLHQAPAGTALPAGWKAERR
jgi:hypothetical protein